MYHFKIIVAQKAQKPLNLKLNPEEVKISFGVIDIPDLEQKSTQEKTIPPL